MRPSRTRAVLSLTAFAVALFASPPAAAQDDIDGSYRSTFTVTESCDLGAKVGSRYSTAIEVARQGSSGLQMKVEGNVVEGSISPSLNFDLSKGEESLTGHFTVLSDGGVTLSGELQSGCMAWAIKGSTKGAPAAPSPPPPVKDDEDDDYDETLDDENTGYAEVDRESREFCKSQREACEASSRYVAEVADAMSDATAAFNPKASDAAFKAFRRLKNRIAAAAFMGGVYVPGPCGEELPAYPMAHALLPVYGRLFAAGLRALAADDAAAVTQVANTVDDMLYAVIQLDSKPKEPVPC